MASKSHLSRSRPNTPAMDDHIAIGYEAGTDCVIKIPPFHYLHLLDTNSNVSRVEVGPGSKTILSHEQLIYGPAKMIIIPPRHYCVVENPAVRKEGSNDPQAVVFDQLGQVKLRHGDQEVRLAQDPFPLFPGERLVGSIQPLQIVEDNSALRLRAKRDFTDRYAKNPDTGALGIDRRAGDEWLFRGLATYYPQAEVEIMQTVHAIVLKPNNALRVRATDDCVDYLRKKRTAGEEWLVKKEGAYLVGVNEQVVSNLQAIKLMGYPMRLGIIRVHLRAMQSFKDARGIDRKAGEEWMITRNDSEAFIPDVHETVIAHIRSTVLTHRQYAIILDPVGEDGKPQLGTKKLVVGPAKFFLRPGERLEHDSVNDVYVLVAEEALYVRAREGFVDQNNKRHFPGDRWFVYGPGEYWPPLEVDVVKRVPAFLKIEPLGLYYFQPVLFALALLAVLIAFYILAKFNPFGRSAVTSHDEL